MLPSRNKERLPGKNSPLPAARTGLDHPAVKNGVWGKIGRNARAYYRHKKKRRNGKNFFATTQFFAIPPASRSPGGAPPPGPKACTALAGCTAA